MSLTLLGLAWADITNIAQVSYQDAAGISHAGISNTVTVAVSVATPLPAPDLSGIDGKTFLVTDDVVLTYNASYTGFIWSISSVSAGAPVLRSLSAAPVSGYTTSVPKVNLASFNLSPGIYQITVQAQNGNQTSPSSTAKVTLVSADLSNVRVFPNPWRKDKHDGHPVTFDGLTGDTDVKIFTTSGYLVRDFSNVNNAVTWDLTDTGGDRVASGLYIYLITNDQGQKTRGKLAIIR